MSTKKLLSVTDLKKYFPLAKSSMFSKEQHYVKANENVSLDIYEGQTIGLVGESGCGKSTFGRVLLQLYSQTGGMSMYYGKSITEFAPKYASQTYNNPQKYIMLYKSSQKKADELTAICQKAGDDATFFQIQDANLATSQAKTRLMQVGKLLGGFMAVENANEYKTLLSSRYKKQVEKVKLNEKLNDVKVRLELETEKNDEQNLGKTANAKLQKLNSQIELLNNKLQAIEVEENRINQLIEALKEKYSKNEEFIKCEKLLDTGIDLARLNYDEMRKLRNHLQIIFQDPYSSLNPRMTVGQIIEEGLVTHNYFKKGSKKMRKYIIDIMEKCGLQEHMISRFPHEFSGGQRQRICIARALAVNPKFVVCDECVSALDVSIQCQIINLLQDLKAQSNLTYLFISHDLSVVRYISDKICVMYLGDIVEFATAEDLFNNPKHPYTVALLSSIPTTDENNDRQPILLEGSMPSPVSPPSGCKFHTRCYMATEKCSRIPPSLSCVEGDHLVSCHYADKVSK